MWQSSWQLSALVQLSVSSFENHLGRGLAPSPASGVEPGLDRDRLHVLDGHLLLGRQTRAVFELCRGVEDTAVARRDLEADDADRGVDRPYLSIQAISEHLLVPDT